MTERGAFSIPGFGQWADLGRSKIYEEIAAGRLVARKCGKRTIITWQDGQDYLNSLPTVEPSTRQEGLMRPPDELTPRAEGGLPLFCRCVVWECRCASRNPEAA